MKIRHSFALVPVLALVASLGPAQASSAYHMNGFGTVTIDGAGLPACLPVVNAPNCPAVNPNNTFDWGNLTVQGAGVLQGHNVAGQYSCASTGTGFESRIYGNTSNYQLTFNFVCTNSAGIGPTYINGWFSNCTSCPSNTAYHNVATHPFNAGGLAQPGVPQFFGFFKAGPVNVAPYTINATNGDPMACNGGFAPSDPSQGTSIITALFVGQCTALEA